MKRQVTLTDEALNITRECTCEQWALMDSVPPAGWEVVSNTCAFYLEKFHSPFASFTPEFGLPGVTVAGAGRWYIWSGIIGAINSDRLMIPTTELLLPSEQRNVFVTVHRQDYLPSLPGSPADFAVNNISNSLDFITGAGKPSLNTLKAYVKVWK